MNSLKRALSPAGQKCFHATPHASLKLAHNSSVPRFTSEGRLLWCFPKAMGDLCPGVSPHSLWLHTPAVLLVPAPALQGDVGGCSVGLLQSAETTKPKSTNVSQLTKAPEND